MYMDLHQCAAIHRPLLAHARNASVKSPNKRAREQSLLFCMSAEEEPVAGSASFVIPYVTLINGSHVESHQG